MSVKRLLTLKNITICLILFLLFILICQKNENQELKLKIEKIENLQKSSNIQNASLDEQNPKIAGPAKHRKTEPPVVEDADTTTTSTTTTTTSTKGTTSKATTSTKEDNGNPRVVRKIHSDPYDASRGTPTDPELVKKREYVKNMMKHAWDGYRLRAWGYNEVKPDSGQ